MKRISFVKAPNPINRVFHSMIVSIFERIRLNNEESRTLAETRDALLPRLVSGALRVGEDIS